jgi:hypothetical protein
MTSTSKTIVILNSSEDWDIWIQTIKTAAAKRRIWDYINPDLPRTINPATMPQQTQTVKTLVKPVRPTHTSVRANTTSYDDLTDGERYRLKILDEDYRLDRKSYEEKEEAIAEMSEIIKEHINKNLHQYTWDKTTYEQLLELKQRLAPTDVARERQLIQQWAELKRRPGKGTNIDTWLQQWEFVYDRCRTMKIPDVEGSRASYDFLAAVDPIAGTFSKTNLITLNDKIRNGIEPEDFKELVRSFRDYRRTTIVQAEPKASAFAVEPPRLGSTAGSEKRPTCICGEKHFWNECPYLNQKVRTKNWKEDPQIRKQVDEKVKEKPFIAERALKEGRPRWTDRSKNQINQQNSPKPPTALMTAGPFTRSYESRTSYEVTKTLDYEEATFFDTLVAQPQDSLISLESNQSPGLLHNPASYDTQIGKQTHRVGSGADQSKAFYGTRRQTAFTVSNDRGELTASSDHRESSYELRRSVILDSGATVHVCNDRTKMSDLRPAFEGEQLIAGSSYIPIEGWGTMRIQVKDGKVVRDLDLKNAALIPSFHTNLASLRLFIKGGVHWDTRQNRLTYDNNLKFCDIEVKYDQWVLQYEPFHNSAFPASSYEPRKDRQGTIDELHRLMGHLHFDSVAHLQEATRGVKVTNKSFDQNCEVCRRTKATRITSRRPRDRALTPYERISWDLIEMKVGIDDNRYASHFLDDDTRMNHFVALPDKRQETILKSIKNLVALVRNWGFTVRTIKLDNDRSLGDEFTAWRNEEGIQVEFSPKYTPEPNGDIERSGKTLIVRARCLKEESGLPEQLWPEMYAAAAYLLNRSPVESLGWKTPIGFLEERLHVKEPQPLISHLVSYGCRGYVFIYNQPKLDRQEPRANIGYLVGYESTNIFRLWIPILNKVVATRDVRFDETKFFRDSFDLDKDKVREEEETQSRTIEIPKLSKPESSYEERIWEIEDENTKTSKDTSYEPTTGQLLTPETTPFPETQLTQQNLPSQYIHTPELREASREEPSTLPTVSTNIQGEGSQPRTKIKPSYEIKLIKGKEIGLDIDSDHIIEGKRTRTKKPDQAHAVQASELESVGQSQFKSAFTAASVFNKPEAKIHRTMLPPAPRNYQQLVRHSHANGFRKAMEREWNDLWRKGTMKEEKLVEVSAPSTILPVMWVFTYKFDEDGFLVKYKARLVVRGDLWQSSEKDKYAATLASRTFRALMAIAAFFDLDIFQFDAVNAFTNADIDETVFVRAPDGLQKEGICYRLLKALYGLPRSPLLWFNDIARTMKEFGLTQVPEAQCLFVNQFLIIFFYVDDIVILCHPSHNEHYLKLRTKLYDTYELRQIDKFEWFLGIRVVRDRKERKIWLCQDAYWEKIAATFGLTKGPFPHTPMSTDELTSYEGESTTQMILSYAQRVGSVNYPAVVTRPDIARTAQKLSEFLVNPGPEHIKAVERAISYGYGTRTKAIEFNPSLEVPVFQASTDAAFADDPNTRHSTEGYLFSLFSGPIDWRCTKQKTVKTSTTEAELASLSHGAAQLYMWQRFFRTINLDLRQEYKIYCDNMQTVRLMLQETPKLVTKLKHIDIHNHWLRQEVKEGRLKVEWITTTEMKADGFTKALPRQKHEEFVRQLNLVDIQDRL